MPFDICIEIPEIPDPFAIPLPGGIEIEDVNLMKMLQPALTPLVPLFDIIDTIVAIFNCIKAIPDMLGPPPDPTVLTASLPDLANDAASCCSGSELWSQTATAPTDRAPPAARASLSSTEPLCAPSACSAA